MLNNNNVHDDEDITAFDVDRNPELASTQNASFCFDFRMSNTVPVKDVKILLNKHCKQWVFQEEKGANTGYEHYQGRLKLKTKLRKNNVIALFRSIYQGSLYLRNTVKANQSNFFYQMKEETRINGPWRWDDKEIPSWVSDVKEFWHWQAHVIKSSINPEAQKVIAGALYNKFFENPEINAQGPRCVNVVIDKRGHVGKSWLTTWLAVRDLCVHLMPADYKDILRQVMCEKKTGLYILDLPRAINKKDLKNWITAIETLKNGCAYDDRYSFKKEYFDRPAVWIFTNEEIPAEFLSADRWRLWEINAQHELVPFVKEEKNEIKEFDWNSSGLGVSPLVIDANANNNDNTPKYYRAEIVHY